MIKRSEDGIIRILSLSYGKDSLACLGAIEELGLPLDGIVHAEVWFNDTIPADLPPMVEFKAKADAIIKERWGFDVRHVCATKKRSQSGNVERERERSRHTADCSTPNCQEENSLEQSGDFLSAEALSLGASTSKLTYCDLFYKTIEHPRTKKKIVGGGVQYTDSREQCKGIGATENSRGQLSTRFRGFEDSRPSNQSGAGETSSYRLYGFPQVKGNWCQSNLKRSLFKERR